MGKERRGQAGDGTNANRTTPAATLAPAGVVVADGGRDHSLALLAIGRVWAWGRSDDGQLGVVGVASRTVPVHVSDLVGIGWP